MSLSFTNFARFRDAESLLPELRELSLHLDADSLTECRHYVLEHEMFRQLHPPGAKVIGLMHSGLQSPALIGMVAQRMREAYQDVPTIVLLPPLASDDLYFHDTIIVTAGTLIDAAGRAFTGLFPEPVRLDGLGCFDAGKPWLLDLAEPAGIPCINSKGVLEVARDKWSVKAGLNAHEILTPPHQVFLDINQRDITDHLEAFSTRHGARALIVKPLSQMGGTGVSVHSVRKIKDAGNALYDILDRYDSAIVETYVYSAPVKGAQSWRVRALTMAGQIATMLVRSGSSEEHLCLMPGSQNSYLHEFARRLLPTEFVERPPNAVQLFGMVADVVKKAEGAFPGGMKEYDFIFPPDYKPQVVGLKMEGITGLRTICALADGTALGLRGAETLIKSWGTLISRAKPFRPQPKVPGDLSGIISLSSWEYCEDWSDALRFEFTKYRDEFRGKSQSGRRAA